MCFLSSSFTCIKVDIFNIKTIKITSALMPRGIVHVIMDWPAMPAIPLQQVDEAGPTEPDTSGSDLARLSSLRDLDALASMVITALPFPPLPLMVLQGMDAADATASSFDLLKQAIIMQRVTGTHRSPEQIANDKTSRLRALQEEMQRHCGSSLNSDSNEWVECAYLIYGKHFRLYFVENYPTCSHDLRFQPLSSVPPAHVMQQAVSHANASLIQAGASGSVDFARYEDVVKYYARDLGTLSDQ